MRLQWTYDTMIQRLLAVPGSVVVNKSEFRFSPACALCFVQGRHRQLDNLGINKIWLLCLVPTSTTSFASDVGYRIAKNV